MTEQEKQSKTVVLDWIDRAAANMAMYSLAKAAAQLNNDLKAFQEAEKGYDDAFKSWSGVVLNNSDWLFTAARKEVEEA